MNFSITSEVIVLLYSIAAGVFIAIIYDLLKILRTTSSAGSFICAVTDTVFWILATIVMFFIIFLINDGKFRWYQFFGAFSGSIIWFLTLSRPFTFFIYKFINIFFKIFNFFLKILLTPLSFMYNIICVSLYFVLHPFLGFLKKIFRKIRLNLRRNFKALRLNLSKK